MNRLNTLKTLGVAFLPIVIFVIADAIFGQLIGIIVAVAVGLAMLLFTYIKERRVDKFILLDTLLLVGLSALSILLDQDIFFKLKPAIIEAIMAALIALSIYTKYDIVQKMTGRLMPDKIDDDLVNREMNRMLKGILFIFIIHIALTVYASYFCSNVVWGFISGMLIYVMVAIYMATIIVLKKIKQYKLSKEEQLPIVDQSGKVIGQAARSVCHNGSKLLHPVVHIHIFNKKGELFLQKRGEDRKIQPGRWDTSVGGHISINDDILKAVRREAREELGIEALNAKHIAKYEWNSEVESELVFTFICNEYDKISIPTEEVKEGRFWSKEEIDAELKRSEEKHTAPIFTPNFIHEYKTLLRSTT